IETDVLVRVAKFNLSRGGRLIKPKVQPHSLTLTFLGNKTQIFQPNDLKVLMKQTAGRPQILAPWATFGRCWFYLGRCCYQEKEDQQ
ncbi:hypothetical protein RUM43_012733, partial [Polyplax serrata]